MIFCVVERINEFYGTSSLWEVRLLYTALVEFIIQLSSKMLRIFLVACLTSVVITVDHSDRECPFDMKEQFSLNGFRDEILYCVFLLARCPSGSITLISPLCSIRNIYHLKTPQVKHSNHILYVGEIHVLFSRNEITNPEDYQFDTYAYSYCAKIQMNMENVTVLETIPNDETSEQRKLYIETVLDLLPKMINTDSEFQMKFYIPDTMDVINVKEIPEEEDNKDNTKMLSEASDHVEGQLWLTN